MINGEYKPRIEVVEGKLLVGLKYPGIYSREDLSFLSKEGQDRLQGTTGSFTTGLCFQLGQSQTVPVLKSIFDRSPKALTLLKKQLEVYSENGLEPDMQLATLALNQINGVRKVH